MIQHDENIGSVLKKLDDLGIADNTIVIYSSDNGPEHSTWLHGGTTPYRSEKMTTWEGGVRVPMMEARGNACRRAQPAASAGLRCAPAKACVAHP